jgi:alginate O-acetyltransferase complex protein AlgI
MVFSTPLFIFGFLPAVLAVYFLVPIRMRNYVALAFSFFFYAWGAPRFIFVVVASCIFDWVLASRHLWQGGATGGGWSASVFRASEG